MVKKFSLNISEKDLNYEKMAEIKQLVKAYFIKNKSNADDISYDIGEAETNLNREKPIKIANIIIDFNADKTVSLEDLDDNKNLTVAQVKEILKGNSKVVDEEELEDIQKWLIDSLWEVANEALVINILGKDVSDKFIVDFISDTIEAYDLYNEFEEKQIDVISDVADILVKYKKELENKKE